jgi:hypothetical protein
MWEVLDKEGYNIIIYSLDINLDIYNSFNYNFLYLLSRGSCDY